MVFNTIKMAKFQQQKNKQTKKGRGRDTSSNLHLLPQCDSTSNCLRKYKYNNNSNSNNNDNEKNDSDDDDGDGDDDHNINNNNNYNNNNNFTSITLFHDHTVNCATIPIQDTSMTHTWPVGGTGRYPEGSNTKLVGLFRHLGCPSPPHSA